MKRDENELDTERSSLMHETTKETPRDIPLCGFMTVEYYQPFFDVDTNDVYARLLQSTFYCRREQNFLALIGEKPDAYGPFWIATTLVFVVAMAGHLNGWFSSWIKGASKEYDFQAILSASSLIYSFASLVPLCLWFVFKQYQPSLKLSSIVCLYGYSLFNYIPAVFLCLYPSEEMNWIVLLIASISSAIFLQRNLAPYVVTPETSGQASLLLSLVGLIPISFMFCLKLYFFQ